MRILGFVISAAALHVVLLAVNLDSSNEKANEFLVGVALVDRQMDSFSADATAADSTAHSVADPADQIDVVERQEQLDKPTVQESLSEVDASRPKQVMQLPGGVEETPKQTAQQAPLLPADHHSSEEILPLPTQQVNPLSNDSPLATDAISQTQVPPVEQGLMPSAKPVAGEAVQMAGEPVALQVSAQPRYGFHPPPSYPGIARRRGWEGTVEFNVRVLATGDVAEVTLKNSSGYKSLDDAARRAIIRWRFTPAKRHGKVVESWVVVPVRFVLDAQTRSR